METQVDIKPAVFSQNVRSYEESRIWGYHAKNEYSNMQN